MSTKGSAGRQDDERRDGRSEGGRSEGGRSEGGRREGGRRDGGRAGVDGRGQDGNGPVARRERAVRSAVEQGLITEASPVVGLLDVTGIRGAAASLRTAFDEVTTPGTPVLHAFAVKAASLVPVLRLLADEGLGCEVASPGELALARAAGLPASRTVLDSPAKTHAELREALDLGIALNADNWEELARLDALVADRVGPPPVGLRINPQIGGGAIDALSTATATSKFGVPLRDDGPDGGTPDEVRGRVVRAFLDRPWLTRVHVHSGSQGMEPTAMAAGARAAYALAEEINATAGRRQVDTLDIGGGLPVDFGSDAPPDFAGYARLLATTVPGLLDGRYGLVTEFGRSLLAKSGLVLARVEYAKSAGARTIAVTHAGAQVATRTAFAPQSWPLRVCAYDAKGLPKGGPTVAQDVAGPCCFAGDLVAENRPLPRLAAGDLAALLDTGAYYFSNHFAYNSLPRPAVYGFTDDPSVPGGVRFALARPQQTVEEIVAESGAAQRDALTGGLLRG
ncbi:diaminopimelate decarboxylase [Streptomyces sp. NPDC051776]|uniref:diaminopimelate decarboxylase n=1 Tax=Streptomyces sp. NPDC051776 TaxID=3155414 RepID=UPI003445A7D3